MFLECPDLYISKEVEQIGYTSTPTSHLNTERLINGKKDFWQSISNSTTRHTKTIIIHDWNLNHSKALIDSLFHELLPTFKIYLWQSDDFMNITVDNMDSIFGDSLIAIKAKPVKHTVIYQMAAQKLGLTADDMCILDGFKLQQLSTKSSSYIVNMSQVWDEFFNHSAKEKKFTLFLQYLSSLNEKIVFNIDCLHLKLLDWLAANSEQLLSIGTLTFKLKYIDVDDKFSDLKSNLLQVMGDSDLGWNDVCQTLETIKIFSEADDDNIQSLITVATNTQKLIIYDDRRHLLESFTVKSFSCLTELHFYQMTLNAKCLNHLFQMAPKLEKMALHHFTVDDSISTGIAPYYALKNLSLSNCFLLNNFHIHTILQIFPNLEFLEIKDCHQLHLDFFSVHLIALKLKALYLHSVSFNFHHLLNLLTNAPELNHLHIEYSELIYQKALSIHESKTFPTIEKFYFNYSQIDINALNIFISSMPQLKDVFISGGLDPTAEIAHNFVKAPLQKLDIYFCSNFFTLMTNHEIWLPTSLKKCKLTINAHNINENLKAYRFQPLPNLTHLLIEQETFDFEVDHWLADLFSHTPNLQELELSEVILTDKSVNGLFNQLPRLSTLIINACDIETTKAITAKLLKHLKILHIVGSLPLNFLKMLLMHAPLLEEITLESFKFESEFDWSIFDLKQLGTVIFTGKCNISSDEFFQLLAQAPFLKYLDITGIYNDLSMCAPQRLMLEQLDTLITNKKIKQANIDMLNDIAPNVINFEMKKSDWNISSPKSPELSSDDDSIDLPTSPSMDTSHDDSSITPWNAYTYNSQPQLDYQFKNKRSSFDQIMIIDKISRYIKLINGPDTFISSIQLGICSQLSRFFLNIDSIDSWNAMMRQIRDWNGKKSTLSISLETFIQQLIEAIQEKDNISRVFFLGDYWSTLILKHPDSYLLYNPWHCIAIKATHNNSWIVYDPNYRDGYKVIKAANLKKAVTDILGIVISVDLQNKDTCLRMLAYQIACPLTFLEQGGYLELAFTSPIHPVIVYFDKIVRQYTIPDSALEGLFIKQISGCPAWLGGLINNRLSLFSHSISLATKQLDNYVEKFKQSLSQLNDEIQLKAMQLIENICTHQLIDLSILKSIQQNYSQANQSSGPILNFTEDKKQLDDVKKYMLKFFQIKKNQHQEQVWLQNIQTLKYDKTLIQCANSEQLVLSLSDLYQQAIKSNWRVFIAHSADDLRINGFFMTKVLKQDGVIKGIQQRGPMGPFYDFLNCAPQYSCLLLLIDYSNFKTEEIIRLNSLLDVIKEVDGSPLPPTNNFKIIGFQDKSQLMRYQGLDFYSRFDCHMTSSPSNASRANLIQSEDIHAFSDDAVIIHMYQTNDWQSRLLGQWQIKEGSLIFQNGPLIKALKLNQHIYIVNAPVHLNSYRLFWEKLFIDEQYASIKILPSNIHHCKGYHWPEKCLDIHTFQYISTDALNSLNQSTESQHCKPFYLNTNSFYRLVKDYAMIDGQITFIDGLLFKHRNALFECILTSALSQHQWAEIFHLASDYSITLKVHVLPSIDIDCLAQKFPITIQSKSDAILELMPKDDWHQSMLIISSDVDASIAQLKQIEPESRVINLTDIDIHDLFETIEVKNDSHESLCLVKKINDIGKLLIKGDRFILTGQPSLEKFNELMPYLSLHQSALKLVIDKSCFLKLHSPFIAQHHLPTFSEKIALLKPEQREFLHHFKSESLKELSFVHLQTLCLTSACDLNAPWLGLTVLQHQEPHHELNESVTSLQYKAFISERIQSIQKALINYPMVIISGQTGVGKSTFIMKELSKYYELYQENQLKSWLENVHGGILFIDEANIGTQNYMTFESLFEPEPFIIENGSMARVTANHKIIFACNPLSHGGNRHLPLLFQRRGNTVIFAPPSGNVLFEQIIKPLFENTAFQMHAFNMTKNLLMIYNDCLLLTENTPLISPRHIKAVIMRSLARVDQLQSIDIASMTQEINHHIHVIILPLLPKMLQTKWHDCVPNGLTTPAHEIKFEHFVMTQSRQHALQCILDTLILRNYRKKYQYTLNNQQKFGDLCAILLESEPGLGKTVFIKALLDSQKIIMGDIHAPINMETNHYYYLPATLSIKQKKEILLKAYVEGNIVMIDEMNGAPMLESFVNALLMGQWPQDETLNHSPVKDYVIKPGFLILATQNPIYMNGRAKSSQAEDARRITLTLPSYTDDEILEILCQKGLKKSLANNLIRAFNEAKKENIQHSAFNHLTVRDLLKASDKLLKDSKHNAKRPHHPHGFFSESSAQKSKTDVEDTLKADNLLSNTLTTSCY